MWRITALSFVGGILLFLGVALYPSPVFAGGTYLSVCDSSEGDNEEGNPTCYCTGQCKKSSGESKMCSGAAITGMPGNCGCDCNLLW
jgi:hypothetical protein